METKILEETPNYRLNECRFRLDVLTMALAGLKDPQHVHPDDALASLYWFASGIASDMTEAIDHMEADMEAAAP